MRASDFRTLPGNLDLLGLTFDGSAESFRTLVGSSRVTGLRPESCWNDCLTRRKSIRPCTPLHVAYEVGAARQQTVRSPRTMYPHSQEWHRNREATVYLPA